MFGAEEHRGFPNRLQTRVRAIAISWPYPYHSVRLTLHVQGGYKYFTLL
jgi:hypothetical protein